MKLYQHTTDGGAVYLCLRPVKGTDEGDIRTAVVRLDGEPELICKRASFLKKFADLLQFVEDIERYLKAGNISRKSDKQFVLMRARKAKAGILEHIS